MKSVFLSALIFCLMAVAAKSDDLSSEAAKTLLIGHWSGFGDDLDDPYLFDSIHCASGKLAVAISRSGRDIQIYFGKWKTDGATVTQKNRVNGAFDNQTLEQRSLEPAEFTNLYHIVELTEDMMIYEWRGEHTRRFEAQKTETGSGISTEKLTRLACDNAPSLS